MSCACGLQGLSSAHQAHTSSPKLVSLLASLDALAAPMPDKAPHSLPGIARHCVAPIPVQVELNATARAAGMPCGFVTRTVTGAACGRGEPGDACWEVSVADTAHSFSRTGCAGMATRDDCAASTLTVRVYETLWGSKLQVCCWHTRMHARPTATNCHTHCGHSVTGRSRVPEQHKRTHFRTHRALVGRVLRLHAMCQLTKTPGLRPSSSPGQLRCNFSPSSNC